MMRRNPQSLCFLGSAFGFLLMAVAVFLFYPGSYYALNKGTDSLQFFASLLFWCGLLLGVLLQLASLILRKRAAPDYRKQYRERQTKRKTGQRIRRALCKNRVVFLMAILFFVGLIGSIVSLADSRDSSYHTFFFLALTVFGACEYLAFNSLNFAYTIRRSESYEK